MTAETGNVTLYGAKDREGQLYLVDSRADLPEDTTEAREFAIASDRVQWSILAVELEEIRGVSVTVRVGEYCYATSAQSGRNGGAAPRISSE
jgi:hypothetical protein